MRAKDVPRDISSRKQDVPAPGDGAASEWLRSYLQESIRPPFGHMASIPGILCQPTFQSLPGRITQVLDHLGRTTWPLASAWRNTVPPHAVVLRDRTYEDSLIQSPRKRQHPLIKFYGHSLGTATIHTFRPYLIRLIYMGETQLSIFCMRQG